MLQFNVACDVGRFHDYRLTQAASLRPPSLDREEALEAAAWRELRKVYDGVVDHNASMKVNLKTERKGECLTAFAPFPKPNIGSVRRRLFPPALRAEPVPTGT